MKTVLLLSASSAKWTDARSKKSQWREEILCDAYEVAAIPDTAEIHLLLDSEFEQVDAFPIVKTNSVISHCSNIRAMHARFADEFPFGIVRSPRRKTGVDCFVVHHLNIVASIKRYLQLLEPKGSRRVVVSIQSISELYVNTYAKSVEARLLLIRTESGIKHVVGQSACVLFCRTVSLNPLNPFPHDPIVESLNETLDHLKSKNVLSEFSTITTVGFSPEQVRQLEVHTDILSKPVDFKIEQPTVNDVREFLASQTPSFATKHRNSQFRKTGQWLKRRIGRVKSRRLRAAALASLILAITSITITQRYESKVRSKSEQLKVKLSALSDELAESQQAAMALSDRHYEIANVLLDVNSLSVVKAPGVVQLLKPLSAALQTYSQINLQELSWTTEEGFSQSGSRALFPIEGLGPSILLVSLRGMVLGADTIRIKQDKFKQFVKQLQDDMQISAINVVQSPLDSAAPQSNGVTTEQPVARFDVSFTLSR